MKSLPKNIEELEYLIDERKFDFDVIFFGKLRIRKNKSPINLKDHSYESCPTESSAGGARLYISNHHSYKSRSQLYIYKSTELESTFFEILIPKKTNVILGCIYRQHRMDLSEFNDYYYVNSILDNFSKENKTVFLLNDFNIDLLNCDQHSPTNECLHSFSFYVLCSYYTDNKNR